MSLHFLIPPIKSLLQDWWLREGRGAACGGLPHQVCVPQVHVDGGASNEEDDGGGESEDALAANHV